MKGKILFLLTRSDAIGGAAVHVADLSSDLADIGMRVKVIIGGDGPVLGLFRNKKVHMQKIPQLVRNISPLKDLIAFVFIYWTIFFDRPDIISIHTSKVGVLGRLACFLQGNRSIYTPHCWSFSQIGNLSWVYELLERVMTLFSSIIVCVSSDEKNAILKASNIDEGRFLVIRNGMKELTSDLKSFDDEVVNFVQIARFERQKDFETLFAAIENIKDSNFRIHLIGDGPLREKYEELCSRTKHFEKVIFHGELRNVERFLRSNRIYILSSKWEGLPRSIIEAMRSRMPVIATDVGGVSELVKNDENGYLVCPGDSLALANRMKQFIDTPKRITEMGRRSKEIYEEEFTYRRMFEEYLLLYGAFLTDEA